MVTTPATAKNVLSVGVSTTGTGGTTPQGAVDAISRDGSTMDGRIKPDVVALELKFVREEQKKRETQAALPVEAEPMVTETRCICLCPEHHNLHQLLEDSLRLRGNICESK